jgi:signal transduction histidine kinase
VTKDEIETVEIRFRPRARLLDTIGGDLIKDEVAGVIELVKNAFDADASRVTVSFKNLSDKKGASILIEDDGHGMTRQDILEHWMSPSTDVKVGKKSPGGRPLLGHKGIGRFSAMRLGDELRLETSPNGVAEVYFLEVDWEVFRATDRYLEDVGLELQIRTDVPKEQGGTSLLITSLNDEWDGRRLERLLRELRLLLSPLPQEFLDTFRIYLDLTDSGLEDGPLVREVQEIEPYQIPAVADYIVTTEIHENGGFSFRYERQLHEDDEIELLASEEGTDIRSKFPEREDWPEFSLPLPCGSVQIQLHIWDRDREILLGKASRLGEAEQLGLRAIRRLLDDISGVAIYRDGFRVRPYGDPDQDWLELAQRRVQNPTMRIGPNQLRGVVSISSVRNPRLEDKSSREGLKENDAYQALRASVLAVLGWMEPYRFSFRKRHRLGRPPPKSTKALLEERKSSFDELRKYSQRHITDLKLRTRFGRLLERAERVSDREHDRLDLQAELLHDFHALGLLARFVLHEGRNLDSSLDSALNNIQRYTKLGLEEAPKRIVIEGDLVDAFFASLVSAIGAEERLERLLDNLDPLTRPRRRRRPKVDVLAIAEKAVAILGPQFEKAGIEVSLPAEGARAVAWEADVFHALFNLLHNSLYWVQQVPGRREITMKLQKAVRPSSEERPPTLEILLSDSGPGVSEATSSSMFDLGYSEKPGGTGIGLFIAREAIERSKGTIELVNPGERGAVFLIALEGV